MMNPSDPTGMLPPRTDQLAQLLERRVAELQRTADRSLAEGDIDLAVRMQVLVARLASYTGPRQSGRDAA